MQESAVTLALFRRHRRHQLAGGGDRSTEHFRAYGARFDHHDADTERGDFASQRVADGFERELRCRVWTIGGHRDLATHGADVHHATLVAHEGRQQRLDHGDLAEQVDLEHASPLVDRKGLDRHVGLDGGVVHHRPYCPALRIAVHSSDQRLDVVRFGDVEDQRLDTRPPDGSGVLVAADTCKDMKPPPGQFTCRRRADAGRRTRDDDDLLDFR